MSLHKVWLYFFVASAIAYLVIALLGPWHPPVGVYIALLAFLGVVVPLIQQRPFTRGERAFWTGVMGFLLVLEILSIYREQRQHDQEQAAARKEQLEGFGTIGKGIEKAIAGSDANFNQTMTEFREENKLNRQISNNITGAGQYCYLEPLPFPSELAPVPPGHVGLFVYNSGPLPLERCFIVIHDNSPVKSPQDAVKRFQPLVARDLGPISPNIHNEGTGTGIFLAAGSYQIRISTRNDIFFEDLTIDANLTNSKKIEVRNYEGKLLHSYP